MHTCTHTYTYVHTYIFTHIHTYIHTYTHTYIHAYVHAYVHTYIHTHIHTYTHTYFLPCRATCRRRCLKTYILREAGRGLPTPIHGRENTKASIRNAMPRRRPQNSRAVRLVRTAKTAKASESMSVQISLAASGKSHANACRPPRLVVHELLRIGLPASASTVP